MKTPDGQLANHIDKVFLLSMWAEHVKNQGRSVIFAGMGRPTFVMNPVMIDSFVSYWEKVQMSVSAVIGYGCPQGDLLSREKMATAMSLWYKTTVLPEHVLFTVGGAGALRVIFDTFNDLFQNLPHYRIITPLPYYTLYENDAHHILHPIQVMQSAGYQLTAMMLQQSIEEAYQASKIDQALPKVVLLCNPNNPLGTVIAMEELVKIADVLRAYPDLYIVLDEAYVEMSFKADVEISLLTLAPDLQARMIILRSATKALAAAGERLAMLMAFEPTLMLSFLAQNIRLIGHAPRSAQRAYAETMLSFTSEDLTALSTYYQKKSKYVGDRLRNMGANMPDQAYEPGGTFYIAADLSDFLGLPLSSDVQQIVDKQFLITTDEDIVYTLLMQDGLMFAPLSYFGADAKLGYVRITCSAHEDELAEMMNRLEARILDVRLQKQQQLLSQIERFRSTLSTLENEQGIGAVSVVSPCALKENNRLLNDYLQILKQRAIAETSTPSLLFFGFTPRLNERKRPSRENLVAIVTIADEIEINDPPLKLIRDNDRWRDFVAQWTKPSAIQDLLLHLDPKERSNFLMWRNTPSPRYYGEERTSPLVSTF